MNEVNSKYAYSIYIVVFEISLKVFDKFHDVMLIRVKPNLISYLIT